MTAEEMAETIHAETAAGERVSLALARRYIRGRISIPYSSAAFGADIEVLDLSVRSFNCLRRAGLNTVGQAAEYRTAGGSLEKIRNLGAKSRLEVCGKLLDFAYQALTERERLAFLRGFAEENAGSLRPAP